MTAGGNSMLNPHLWCRSFMILSMVACGSRSLHVVMTCVLLHQQNRGKRPIDHEK
ncbi:hypothetical protein BCR43DRAFT_122736 [Syncephalastrum racemosum]|uniref:Uncharacterized protein n=1 Tax=Syncephalastrum racemosum TaxID=13706 RepID=A0A1X2H0H0_SYNRA|nr:hypothetical protein BCR43DRAFT_122736 [Syncephalastrum racemosum]